MKNYIDPKTYECTAKNMVEVAKCEHAIICSGPCCYWNNSTGVCQSWHARKETDEENIDRLSIH